MVSKDRSSKLLEPTALHTPSMVITAFHVRPTVLLLKPDSTHSSFGFCLILIREQQAVGSIRSLCDKSAAFAPERAFYGNYLMAPFTFNSSI
ncbi:MAG TPA: hypothetical protein VFS81_13395, partial [Candidatus Binatia bacterium]|nr:hypothetical protein [Candidatus Binatia bacterium]